jgi:hypothetical protein
MPLMYMQNTLQMEWCLDCHRNPAKNLRPTGEIYNMAWESPAEERPVWCSAGDVKTGTPTAQSVNCTTKDPAANPVEMASVTSPALLHTAAAVSDAGATAPNQTHAKLEYRKFTSQDELGHFLLDRYKIRTPRELTSCEVCHR